MQFSRKKNTEKQQSHYLKLKKIRENEKKKRELIRLERAKKLELARSKRKKSGLKNEIIKKNKLKNETILQEEVYKLLDKPIKKKRIRRTKQQLMLEKEGSINLHNNRTTSLSQKMTTNTISLENKKSTTSNKFVYNHSVNKIDENLQKRKKIYKTKQSLIRIKSKEFIEDEETSNNDSDESESDGSDEKNTSQSLESKIKKISSKNNNEEYTDQEQEEDENDLNKDNDVEDEVGDEESNDDNKTSLIRECFVCNAKIHQNRLSEHCSEHYYESTKCNKCDKVSTNPSNFVTHILSHLGKFFTIN